MKQYDRTKDEEMMKEEEMMKIDGMTNDDDMTKEYDRMKFMKYLGFIVALLGCISLQAQDNYKFRVYFTDKSETEFTLDAPEQYLSERALLRRTKQGIAIDSTDLPVCGGYVSALEELGATCVLTSKWNNTALMSTPDKQTAERFLQLAFVDTIRQVWEKPDTVFAETRNRKEMVKNKWTEKDDYYGVAADQIRMHHGEKLHDAGFRGKGIQVAVIDAGYLNVDLIKLFKRLNIIGTRDFVNPQSDIYAEHYHGLKVLSCMAANRPYVMVGTAPEAGYWLLRSEDNDTEQLTEEDYWSAAIEFADSVGVDVVNSSLGYYDFDNDADNYQYRDLDGRTAMISRSADKAVDKGMLVVCSAGNSGAGSWKKITPPADAVNVLAVGAVNSLGLNATFSSVGNTTDGRIKPDVMAIGFLSAVASDNGSTSIGHGTSFAAPIFCGLAACLWQACPWLTVHELIDIIRTSGDRSDCPDNIFGYGVPDLWKAYQMGQERKEECLEKKE